MIRNPILPGFNPDPSIVRVGEDYYIATSTFEWFPGVQIHHSRDLENWRLITRPLRRASQLDMRGDPDSCGVWAPCLSHADGLFHLIYTDVKRYGRTTTAGASGPRCATSTIIWSPRRRSTATGPIPSTSTAAASIRRCSTTRTAANIWSTCCGTIAPVATASPVSSARNIRPRPVPLSVSAEPSLKARRSASPKRRTSTDGTAIITS
jgi:hypothetical protein